MLPSERRLFFRHSLSTLYIPYYDKLCAALPMCWAPYSGTRTFAEQTLLYNKGRTSPPIGKQYIVTEARAGQSAHNYACASDWTWFDEDGNLKWLEKEDDRWKEYVDAVVSVGLRSGLAWSDIDHNEVKISCDWPHILLVYNRNGMLAAQQKIEEAMR